MNIEDLKSGWAAYNRRIGQSALFNLQLIESMIRERSRSRASTIRRESRLLGLLLFAELLLLMCVIAGNPFDFVFYWQFIPFLLLAACVIAALWSLYNTITRFGQDRHDGDLAGFLQRLVAAYDTNKKSKTWFVTIFFSAGALTTVSFIPHKLQTKELWPAIGESLISIGVSLAIYYLAFKSGLLNSSKKPGFKHDLQELNQLRLMAHDLNAPVKVP